MPFSQTVVPQRVTISEIYRDNAQNILEKTAVSSMIGLLQQLNSVSVYASEVFADIFNETEKNAKRIQNVRSRIQKIESRVPKTEKMFAENAPSFFYDHPYTQREWQRRDPLHGLIFRRDRAGNQVNRRRNFAQGAPDFSVMDQFSATGPCSKSYSDPNFFMNEWLEAEKRKMEEEKAKRKQRKERRKKKQKREVKKTILKVEKKRYNALGQEFDDPKQMTKQSSQEVLVKQYTLSDESGLRGSSGPSSPKGGSKGNGAPPNKARKKKQSLVPEKKPIHQHGQQASYMNPTDNSGSNDKLNQLKQLSPVILAKDNPPPVPGNAGGPPPAAFAMGGGPPQPPMPPIPGQSGGPPAPPGGAGGPPPVPVVQQPKRPLTGAEMAARSAAMAGDYRPAIPVQRKPEPVQQKMILPSRSNDLLSQIKGGKKLKKVEEVKRERPMDARSMLLANLRKGANLKHVDESEKNKKKEEEVDRTVHAILQRRAFLQDDSDEESDSSWGSESD